MCEFQISEFKDIDALKNYFKNERFCIEYFIKMRWPNGVECPYQHCNSKNVCTFPDGKRFKCRECRNIFSYKVGTIFHNTKLSLKKWYTAIYLLVNDSLGVSSYQMAKYNGVTQTTALFMMDRIRYAFRNENEDEIFGANGDVQCDETYMKGKNKNKHSNKKTINGQGRSLNPATVPIVGMVDTELGKAKVFKVANTEAKTITPLILRNVVKGATVKTDEWHGYKDLIEYFVHLFVNHGAKEYCKGEINTNTIEGLWSILKKLVYARYRKVSIKYIQAYLNELVFRYNMRNNSPFTKFNSTLRLGVKGNVTKWQLKNEVYSAAA